MRAWKNDAIRYIGDSDNASNSLFLKERMKKWKCRLQFLRKNEAYAAATCATCDSNQKKFWLEWIYVARFIPKTQCCTAITASVCKALRWKFFNKFIWWYFVLSVLSSGDVFRVECPRLKSTCAIKTLRNVINDLKVLCRWFTMVNGTEIHLHMTILKCIVNFHLPAHFLICCIGKPVEIDYQNMIETHFYGRHFKALEANAFTTERIVVMFDEKSSSTPNRKSCGYIELFWT